LEVLSLNQRLRGRLSGGRSGRRKLIGLKVWSGSKTHTGTLEWKTDMRNLRNETLGGEIRIRLKQRYEVFIRGSIKYSRFTFFVGPNIRQLRVEALNKSFLTPSGYSTICYQKKGPRFREEVNPATDQTWRLSWRSRIRCVSKAQRWSIVDQSI